MQKYSRVPKKQRKWDLNLLKIYKISENVISRGCGLKWQGEGRKNWKFLLKWLKWIKVD